MLQMILGQLETTIKQPSMGNQRIIDVQSVLCGLVQVIMARVGS